MGFPKALLPFGPELMLNRVIRQLATAVDAWIVVAAAGQPLPVLPPNVMVVRDQRPGRGPLEGLAAGMREAESKEEIFYVTSCDVPLLKSAWVRRLIELLQDDDDIVVPVDGRYHHPLAAVYRRRILPVVETLLAEDRRRPFFLFEKARTRRIDVDDLRRVDPELESLINVNNADDYIAALEREGFALSPEVRRRLEAANREPQSEKDA